MARRFLDDVRADVALLLADNIVGAISPLDVRTVLGDMIDSLTDDEVGMTSPPSTVLALTPVMTEYPGIFDASIGSVPGFIVPNVVTARMDLGPTAGFSYSFSLFIQAEAAQNAEMEFQISRDGVPIGESWIIIGRGPGRPVSAAAAWIELSAPANAEFGAVFLSPGSDTFTLTNAFMLGVVKPTNNP
jgi:hypothetical protein